MYQTIRAKTSVGAYQKQASKKKTIPETQPITRTNLEKLRQTEKPESLGSDFFKSIQKQMGSKSARGNYPANSKGKKGSLGGTTGGSPSFNLHGSTEFLKTQREKTDTTMETIYELSENLKKAKKGKAKFIRPISAINQIMNKTSF